MAAAIKSHGLTFGLEGDGFVRNHANDDFCEIADAIEATLDAMALEDVADMHAGSIMSDETGEFVDREAFDRLQAIADRACRDQTATWANPNAAFVMISAIP